MEVQIISKDTVKPSVPTPPHLRTYKLCILDQLTPQLYIPIILFYSSPAEAKPTKPSHFLKKALSEALTSFYPLAGRIRNDWSCAECNDHGVTFIEAQVSMEMSVALEQQNTIRLQQLLPCKPQDKAAELTSQVLLAVQVNYFGCGGIGIGVCIWHEIGDASSLASFLNIWGAIARGAIDNNDVIDGVIIDSTLLFPPQDSATICEMKLQGKASENGKKRFLIDGDKVAALKKEIGLATTRFEAVSALIWGAVIATNEDEKGKVTVTAGFPVNLRKRLNPPLPDHCLGNIIQATLANWADHSNFADHNALAQTIGASKKMMNSDFIRQCHAEGGYLNSLRAIAKEGGVNKRIFSLSSWCGFPFYEADFGWGKPVWICPAMSYDDSCIFTDTRDGKGVEAWVGLGKEDMEKFLQDPGIVAYASFSRSA